MHQNHFPRSLIIPHFYIFFYFCVSLPPLFSRSLITKGYISRAFPLFTIWKVWIVVFYWQTVSDFVRTSSGGSWNVFVTKGSRARVIRRLTRLSKRRPVFYSLLELFLRFAVVDDMTKRWWEKGRKCEPQEVSKFWPSVPQTMLATLFHLARLSGSSRIDRVTSTWRCSKADVFLRKAETNSPPSDNN